MIVTICYFLKSIKSVFILVSCNTSLCKNYVAHTYVTLICVIGWIWEKNRFVWALWLSVHMKSVAEQGFFHAFAFDNKAPKTFVKFQIWWKRLKFERRLIQIRTFTKTFKMSAVCSDRSSRSESTGRRSGLWRSCSGALPRSGNASTSVSSTTQWSNWRKCLHACVAANGGYF